MVMLNSNDAAILARVAKYPRVGTVRRRNMLRNASTEAQTIGDILITGNQTGAPADFVRAALDIREWAAEEQSVDMPTFAYAER